MEDNRMNQRERHAHFIGNPCCCTNFCIGRSPLVARYVYAFFFLITSVLAWIIRDYGHIVLSELQILKACHGTKYCLGTEGVLRISFGGFIFFFVMFLTTTNTKKVTDPRNSWHSQWWPAKIIMWMLLMTVPFFIPSSIINLYGRTAHFGAGVFLIIQLFSVNSFITWLSDCCRSEKNAERCRVNMMLASVATYTACIVGIVLMYVWYAPKPSCRINILFITLTLALLQIITYVSVHPKINAGFLAPGLMGIYMVFLCWCAIRSEPESEVCNKKAESATNADWIAIVSFVVAILVLAMATFSTGIDSKCLQFKKSEARSEDDVPYGYGFFHFVFATGAMYFGMLFIGWNEHKRMKKWTIDVGWASTWVRVVNEWLAAVIYIWMLLAPLIWKRGNEST